MASDPSIVVLRGTSIPRNLMACDGESAMRDYERGTAWINAEKRERRYRGQTSRAESSLDGWIPPTSH